MYIGADFERYMGLARTKDHLREVHQKAIQNPQIVAGFEALKYYLGHGAVDSPKTAKTIAHALLAQGTDSVAFNMMRGTEGLHKSLSSKTSGEGFLHIDSPFLYYSPTVEEALVLGRFPQILRGIKKKARLEGRQRVLESLTGSLLIAQTILNLEKSSAMKFTKDVRTNIAGELHLVATNITGVDIGLTFDGNTPSYSYLYVHQLGTLHSLEGKRSTP